MELWLVAWPVFSARFARARMARTIRPTVLNDRTQRRILSHTDCRSHSRLGRTDARRLHICLEGLQIHCDTSRNSLALLEDRLGPLGKKSRPGSVSTSLTI